MKKLLAFALAAVLMTAAVFVTSSPVSAEALIGMRSQVYTEGKVDIAFDNTKLTEPMKVLPGATAEKTVKIHNQEDSVPTWVWFSVTVPAMDDQPLLSVSGNEDGWILLSTQKGSDTLTYTYGYEKMLEAGETTSAGMTELTVAAQIDLVNGQYCWVVNGEIVPLEQDLSSMTVSFDAYAVAVADGDLSVEAVYQAWPGEY